MNCGEYTTVFNLALLFLSTMPQSKQLGEKTVYLPSCPNPLLREIRAKTQGRNLEVGTVKGAVGWLTLQGCLANFLVQYRTTCSENGVSCNRLGLPITINQDSCPQTWPQASLFWLIARDPLILGNSCLYHAEIKN